MSQEKFLVDQLIQYYQKVYGQEGWDLELLEFRLEKRKSEAVKTKAYLVDLDADIKALQIVIKQVKGTSLVKQNE